MNEFKWRMRIGYHDCYDHRLELEYWNLRLNVKIGYWDFQF